MDFRHFSEEEIERANRASLTAIARLLGFTPIRVGAFLSLKEMDSIRIYNDKTWYRWSNNTNGNVIGFIREFSNLNFPEAVLFALNESGLNSSEYESKNPTGEIETITKRRSLILPEANSNNKLITDYLNNKRAISLETIEYFINKEIVYETKQYHNLCFLGFDKEGIVRCASLRGIDDENKYRRDVAGANKHFGINVANKDSSKVYVFEAAIDMMSYVDIFKDFDSNIIALGMLSDNPLKTFLSYNPGIKSIIFCLDNDPPGKEACDKYIKAYGDSGYAVDSLLIPKGHKDLNDWAKAIKSKSEKPVILPPVKRR